MGGWNPSPRVARREQGYGTREWLSGIEPAVHQVGNGCSEASGRVLKWYCLFLAFALDQGFGKVTSRMNVGYDVQCTGSEQRNKANDLR
jgi:hypothetical protein